MNKTDVITLYGSRIAIAEALGITKQAVSQWPELIPKGAALELQSLTSGSLKCDLSLYKNRRQKRKDKVLS